MLIALIIVSMARPAMAGDAVLCPAPVFVNCPGTVSAMGFDTIRYVLQVVDSRTGDSRPDTRFFLAKGYGNVDSLTGEYSLWMEPARCGICRPATVGAYFADSPRVDTVTCSLLACFQHPNRPQITNCPNSRVRVTVGNTLQLQLSGYSEYGILGWSVTDDNDAATTVSISNEGLFTFSSSDTGRFDEEVMLRDRYATTSCFIHITVTENSAFAVRIQTLASAQLGLPYAVGVSLSRSIGPSMIDGFDLLITYDNSALSLQSVVRGPLFADCEWEYFTYRFGAIGGCESCPSGMIRVLGIAETNNGPENHPIPSCVGAGRILFALEFHVLNDRTLECQFLPIRFFWYDCDNNTLISEAGTEHFLANRVFDHGDSLPFDPSLATLPGIYGIPDGACEPFINDRFHDTRDIDFINGGMHIACSRNDDYRGDLNLNGFPFEFADLVVYLTYFLKELAAFQINPQGQIAASDVNGDGQTLTVEDMVCLYNIALGTYGENTTCLGAGDPPASATFYAQPNGLWMTATDSIGAVALTVKGNFVPEPSGNVEYQFDGENTRMLAVPVLDPADTSIGRPVPEGALFHANTAFEILSISAATYRGGKVNCQVEYRTDAIDGDHTDLPGSFALHQNYPNPFNAGTVITLDLPRASNVTLEIFNLLGSLVYRTQGEFAAGSHRVEWDGRTSGGAPAASGVYYYRLTAGSFVATKKMLLLK